MLGAGGLGAALNTTRLRQHDAVISADLETMRGYEGPFAASGGLCTRTKSKALDFIQFNRKRMFNLE